MRTHRGSRLSLATTSSYTPVQSVGKFLFTSAGVLPPLTTHGLLHTCNTTHSTVRQAASERPGVAAFHRPPAGRQSVCRVANYGTVQRSLKKMVISLSTDQIACSGCLWGPDTNRLRLEHGNRGSGLGSPGPSLSDVFSSPPIRWASLPQVSASVTAQYRLSSCFHHPCKGAAHLSGGSSRSRRDGQKSKISTDDVCVR